MFLRPTGSQWRTPEVGKSVIVSSYRGVTRVQSWPRKRGAARTPAQAKRELIFATWQRLIKHLRPETLDYERRAINEHNRTHRGQRGSAAIRFRDWLTQVLYGRGIAVDVPNGPTFYPPAVSRDASFILDHITDQPQHLMQRAGQQWDGLPPGNAGDLLTSAGAGNPATWQAQ